MRKRRRLSLIRAIIQTILWLGVVLVSPALEAQEYVPGEIIVKLKSRANGKMADSSFTFIGKAISQKGMVLERSFKELNMHHFRLKAGADVMDQVNELRSDPDVEYAEPNYIFRRQDVSGFEATYSPSEIASMSGDVSGSSTYMATGADIQAPDAWPTLSSQSEKPIVAVIDTGLDVSHSVFTDSNALWTNSGEIPNNGVDDDGNGYVDDVHGYNFVDDSGVMYDDDGHGTHVSGIVLGVGQDIFNTPLDDAKIQIMPLKFLDGHGVGSTAEAIKAIYYAVQNGATVLNNSWGGPNYSTALHEAVAYSYDQGVAFVAAAGNNADNNDSSSMYPANYDVPNVISVAATTDSDVLASFSNYGKDTVSLGSPGVFILSTIPNDYFATSSGTSMAAPFVSGLAALIKYEQPGILGYQVKQIVNGFNDGVSGLSGKTITGGRVNINTAIGAAKVATIQSTQPGYSFSGNDREVASALASSGGCGLVHKMTKGSGGLGGGLGTWYVLLVIGLFAIPFAVWTLLRERKLSGRERRRYDRFSLNTDVRVKHGDRELVGSVRTISMGGVKIDTEALLEDGGLVSMTISSPDGKEQIDVQGQVVWSEQCKAYGVEFNESRESVLDIINNWTKSLMKV